MASEVIPMCCFIFFLGFVIGISYVRNERLDEKYSSKCPPDIPKGIAPPNMNRKSMPEAPDPYKIRKV